jgi:hypothetical protein
MRIDVRVSPPRLSAVLPKEAALLRARLAAVRTIVGRGPLPRTSQLREAVAAAAGAYADEKRPREDVDQQ